jgi:hypothetical protein
VLPTSSCAPGQLFLLWSTLPPGLPQLAVLLELSGPQIYEIASVNAGDINLDTGEILTPRGVSRADPALLALHDEWPEAGPLI